MSMRQLLKINRILQNAGENNLYRFVQRPPPLSDSEMAGFYVLGFNYLAYIARFNSIHVHTYWEWYQK